MWPRDRCPFTVTPLAYDAQRSIERQAAAYDYADLVRATGAEAEVVLAAEYGDAEISDLWEVGENPTNVAVLNFLDRCLTTA